MSEISQSTAQPAGNPLQFVELLQALQILRFFKSYIYTQTKRKKSYVTGLNDICVDPWLSINTELLCVFPC